MQRDEEAASRTIVFIHGGWLTPTCWDSFVSFFESKGYRCLAPAWPGKDRPVEAIRADPSPLAGLGMAEIIDHYDRIIRGLDEPPILIGHSFGALFVQVLLDRGLGSAGIAIDSAPPKGVFALHPASLLAVGRILLIPFGWRKVVRWTFTEFRHASTRCRSAGSIHRVRRWRKGRRVARAARPSSSTSTSNSARSTGSRSCPSAGTTIVACSRPTRCCR